MEAISLRSSIVSAWKNAALARRWNFLAILADNFGKEELTSPLHDWLQTILAGSAEHTRNGYDALHAVRSAFGKLAYPAVAIAISRFKVHCESRDVIHSCLHAIESVMNQMGFALAERTTLVLGAQGALGRKAMDILQARIGSKSLFGVDIVQPEPEPDWTYAPNLGLLPDHALEQADLFLGSSVHPSAVQNGLSGFFSPLARSTCFLPAAAPRPLNSPT